ncbi:homeodomain-like containing protein [Babesia caballi]|uniref:Homeodomain-like containing protein n=1 Tax=Babesia caballi TaxID=5871 RepID=A0AAV4M209_BABCB|nr:homeodomain-like containing protein [Babesia caballi]
MDPPGKGGLALAGELPQGAVREAKAADAGGETVWERVQRLGRSQDPFERPVAVEPAQSASNVDLSFFGADVQCLLGARHHVADTAFNKRGQYASAYKRTKSLKWSAEDTLRFYEAVRNFGSDLLMVRSMLPEFTDKQIYDKFKLEEKRHPDKLHLALRSRTKIPLEKFEKRHGKIDRSRHYDPSKDPVLLQKKSQKTHQLALRGQVDSDRPYLPLEPAENADASAAELEPEAEVQVVVGLDEVSGVVVFNVLRYHGPQTGDGDAGVQVAVQVAQHPVVPGVDVDQAPGDDAAALDPLGGSDRGGQAHEHDVLDEVEPLVLLQLQEGVQNDAGAHAVADERYRALADGLPVHDGLGQDRAAERGLLLGDDPRVVEGGGEVDERKRPLDGALEVLALRLLLPEQGGVPREGLLLHLLGHAAEGLEQRGLPLHGVKVAERGLYRPVPQGGDLHVGGQGAADADADGERAARLPVDVVEVHVDLGSDLLALPPLEPRGAHAEHRGKELGVLGGGPEPGDSGAAEAQDGEASGHRRDDDAGGGRNDDAAAGRHGADGHAPGHLGRPRGGGEADGAGQLGRDVVLQREDRVGAHPQGGGELLEEQLHPGIVVAAQYVRSDQAAEQHGGPRHGVEEQLVVQADVADGLGVVVLEPVLLALTVGISLGLLVGVGGPARFGVPVLGRDGGLHGAGDHAVDLLGNGAQQPALRVPRDVADHLRAVEVVLRLLDPAFELDVQLGLHLLQLLVDDLQVLLLLHDALNVDLELTERGVLRGGLGERVEHDVAEPAALLRMTPVAPT